MIRKRMIRTGDGSNQYSNIKDLNKALEKFVQDQNNNIEEGITHTIWGWDDKDMTQDERQLVTIRNMDKNRQIKYFYICISVAVK